MTGTAYLGLALDYDGTLATDGRVPDATVEALTRFRQAGRRLLLVTGRHLPDLATTFPRLDLFDAVVAENGGVMTRRGSGTPVLFAPAPSSAFVDALRDRGVRFSVGATIVATEREYAAEVRAVILELAVILNKGAVMVLPPGVNKGSGVAHAAAALALPLAAIVGVGDAENDEPLLRACGLGVAVANALPSLKDAADLVTRGARGEGVAEVIARVLAGDLAGVSPRPRG